MFRTFLIVAATLLAIGTCVLAIKIPVKADMKRTAQILTGLGLFGVFFFCVTRLLDDNYFWWFVPAFGFSAALGLGLVRIDDIKRLIDREKPSPWLTQLSPPITGATMRDYQIIEDLDFSGLVEPDEEPEPPRRFLDTFYIADEADLGPTELELQLLDDFIFTARHGYLVHDRGGDNPVCDVMTIHPGMSLADLIDAAKLHECVKEVAA